MRQTPSTARRCARPGGADDERDRERRWWGRRGRRGAGRRGGRRGWRLGAFLEKWRPRPGRSATRATSSSAASRSWRRPRTGAGDRPAVPREPAGAPKERFAALFALKPRWTMDELEPCLERRGPNRRAAPQVHPRLVAKRESTPVYSSDERKARGRERSRAGAKSIRALLHSHRTIVDRLYPTERLATPQPSARPRRRAKFSRPVVELLASTPRSVGCTPRR